MQQWPGNPVASMEVIQSPFSTSIQPSSSKTQFNVLGGTIQFSVPLTFNNNAVVSDQAFFSGTLYKMSSGTWVQQDLQSVILDAAPASVKTGMLALSVNMVEYKEQYAIYLKCGTTLKHFNAFTAFIAGYPDICQPGQFQAVFRSRFNCLLSARARHDQFVNTNQVFWHSVLNGIYVRFGMGI